MQNRSTHRGWQQLLDATLGHRALGVVAMVLVIVLASVLTGAHPGLIYALVALVAAVTILVAVTTALLGRKTDDRTNESKSAPGRRRSVRATDSPVVGEPRRRAYAVGGTTRNADEPAMSRRSRKRIDTVAPSGDR
jgi:hypothetical protein